MGRPSREVTIVSSNPETLDGLQAYLGGAGIAARCTRDLAVCRKLDPKRTLAVVLFPDDFRLEKVLATIRELVADRAEALVVVVTSHPQSYAAVPEALVVPRPVWGWAILDAIRAHVGGRSEP